MSTRSEFARALAGQNVTEVERAIGFLWFYRQTQLFEDRTASELADDMSEEGFSKANVSRLDNNLKRSRFIIRGVRPNSLRINLQYIPELSQRYSTILGTPIIQIEDHVIPFEFVSGTDAYFEKITHDINGCYQYGFYDACAVLMRRLMESLIIEVYISARRANEIRSQGAFFMLDRLIGFICSDNNFVLSRNTLKTMNEVKRIGDTAAHDRIYLTNKIDIDDIKQKYRRLIQELLVLSIKP